jgi:hypothetical protein
MAIKQAVFFIILFIFCANTSECLAAWGLSVVVEGPWGEATESFGLRHGDTQDRFPNTYYLTNDGAIIVQDSINGRFKIYSGGKLEKITKCLNLGENNWTAECNIDGKYLMTNGEGDILTLLQNWNPKTLKSTYAYNLTTPTGELLATYEEKPLELGFERTHRALPDNQYLQIIEFEDVTFAIVTTGGIDGFVRDAAGNLYGTESITGIETGSRKRVHKFDRCSREVAHLDLPEDDIRYEDTGIGDAPTTHVTVIEEYGLPVIGPDGSVYTWKRTPDTYSILKWTWVDSPDDPQPGPDVPTNLTVQPSIDGLYLTWGASPQDPGCVDGYEVERATSAGGIYSTVKTTDPGVLKFNDTGALPGTTYFYKVRAKGGGEFSPHTAEVSGSRIQ